METSSDKKTLKLYETFLIHRRIILTQCEKIVKKILSSIAVQNNDLQV